MPNNTKPAGMKQEPKIQVAPGVWINNKFAGMRLRKNTRPSDVQKLNAHAGKYSHTSPIKRHSGNDGLYNPANASYSANERRKENIRRNNA